MLNRPFDGSWKVWEVAYCNLWIVHVDLRLSVQCELACIFHFFCVLKMCAKLSIWSLSWFTSPRSPSMESLGLGNCWPLMTLRTNCFFNRPGKGSSAIGLKEPARTKDNRIPYFKFHISEHQQLYCGNRFLVWVYLNIDLIYRMINWSIEYCSLLSIVACIGHVSYSFT